MDTPAHLDPVPMREAMRDLEFVTVDQVRAANDAIARLTIELNMMRNQLAKVTTERNYLQAYASDINARCDMLVQISDGIRANAKDFAVKAITPEAEPPAAPAPKPRPPTEVCLDRQSEEEVRRIMENIPPRPDPRMPTINYPQ